MIDFYEKHAGDDRFEIIAFHDASAKTLSELDQKLAPIKEKHWKGRDLPFPILMDSSGKTIKQFDVSAFPTVILIDPEGRLVGRGKLETLEQALAGKVKTPEPYQPPRKVAQREDQREE